MGQDSGRKPDDNISPKDFNPDEWAKKEPAEAIPELFRDANVQISESIRWYKAAKGGKARWSSRLRSIAILSGVLGGLMPIVGAIFSAHELAITQFGYILVGIAAGALAFDRFFGLSSGWIRYMSAMTTIERLRMEFTLDWAKMLREAAPPASPDLLKFVDRWIALRNALAQTVKEETDAWANEFRASMADLDKYLQDTRAKTEARVQEVTKQQAALQPGSVNLSWKGDVDGDAEILLDGRLFTKTMVRTVTLGSIASGPRAIAIRGVKAGKPVGASKSIPVEGGKVVDLAIEF
jgi:hypothetical protein